MNKITKEQKLAIKRVYDRGPIERIYDKRSSEVIECEEPASYLQFRRSVYRSFGPVVAYWCGMSSSQERNSLEN